MHMYARKRLQIVGSKNGEERLNQPSSSNDPPDFFHPSYVPRTSSVCYLNITCACCCSWPCYMSYP